MKTYHVMGSCHIDLAWRGDYLEYESYLEQLTVIVLDMLEQHPDFTYVLEQAYHYRMLKKKRPDLIAKLKKVIAEGRVEVVGGMASTMETNIPCAESFVRNQLMGIQWFKTHLDAEIQTSWLIDTFGIHPQVPQILSQFGIHNMMANRFGGEKLYDVFWSVGLDGSRTLIVGRDVFSVNLPTDQNSRVFFKCATHANQLDDLFASAQRSTVEGVVLLNAYQENETPPSRRLIENSRRLNESLQACGTGKAIFSLPHTFFKALSEENHCFPTENGDLNPEFTGTFSQRVEIRLQNRKSESMLLDAEKCIAFLLNSNKSEYKELIEKDWWDLSFVHFHDVFTGSHPDCVFQDVLKRLNQVQTDAKYMIEKALGSQDVKLDAPQKTITVMNTLPFERYDWVEFNLKKPGAYAVWDHNTSVISQLSNGSVRFLAHVPAMGSKQYHLVDDAPQNTTVVMSNQQAVLENDFVKLIVHETEGVSLFLKAKQLWLLDKAKDFLILQQDDGNFQFELPTGSERYAWASSVTVESYQSNDAWQQVTANGIFASENGQEDVVWSIEFMLRNDQSMVEFHLDVDWHAKSKRLRIKLPTAIQGAGDGVFEVPFGVVSRKAYVSAYNKKGEWPIQRFAAVENGECGLSLINRGVASAEILSGTIYSTLLRAPVSIYAGMVPDETSSQHGEHHFDFALLPYEGNWKEAGLLRFAQCFNHPLYSCYVADDVRPISSHLSIDKENIVLTTVKLPESTTHGGIVLRMYEATGSATTCNIYVAGAQLAYDVNMREEIVNEIKCDHEMMQVDFNGFEIKTILVKR